MSSKTGKRLNPFQHARKRPDTYIGSVQTIKKTVWIFQDADEETENKERIIQKTIKYNSGLERIFVEMGSNIIDNKWRSDIHKIPMKNVEVDIDEDTGTITMTNDGYFIPAEKKEYAYEDFRTGKTTTEKLYPAEIFFGEMLAGTNFDDDEERKTSGRNGMGAKATNVFSKKFVVEHADPDSGKKFIQIYTDAGTKRSKPEITSYKNKTGYTKISFTPDYEYFNYPSSENPKMDHNLFLLFKRHVAEMAMITGLSVKFNGEKLKVKNLSTYSSMYYPDAESISFTSEFGDECVLVERTPDTMEANDIENVSFVNGIHTQGGVHVELWSSELIGAILTSFNSRKPKKGHKPLKASSKLLYPYFILFIRCEIDKPSFATQTKDYLTGSKDKDNEPIELKLYSADDKKKKEAWKRSLDTAIKKIMKWNFVKDLEARLELIAETSLTKTRKKGMNLGDHATHANWYKKKDKVCGLIITEGDSAKTTADRGRSSIENGDNLLGSFAIKGKFINAQTHSLQEVCKNAEVKILMGMINLRFGADYSDDKEFAELHYKYVWVMADADDDGIHIRGLLANFFYKFWPALYERKFFRCFGTAVVKLFPKKKKEGVLMFFSSSEFEEWKTRNPDEIAESGKFKNYVCKYYKGLGTLLPHEMPEYFEDPKLLELYLDGNEKEFMELGFSDKCRDDRKKWITKTITKPTDMSGSTEEVDDVEVEQNTEPFMYEGQLPLADFVDKQLVIYHRMTLERAIPNMYDGFKRSQRQCFYGIQKANLREERDLEKLAGAIKSYSEYHHGGNSIYGTIVCMAQGIVGSNNIPLLQNKGEYGSRMKGGKDHGQPRYLHTMLDPIVKAIFPEEDDPLLKQLNVDGNMAEYENYYPIIPMILINGAEGIACGFSTSIPCYNPDTIVEWIEKWLDSEDGTVTMSEDLKPWYRGFIGEIELVPDSKAFYKSYITKGILEKIDEKPKKGGKGSKGGQWWQVRELPIGYWTGAFKSYLEFLMTGEPPEGSKKKKAKDTYIKQITYHNTVNTVLFKFQTNPDFIPDMNVKGNMTVLKNSNSLGNMVVLDENGYPRRYKCPEHLLQDFCRKRLVVYGERRDYYLKLYNKELKKETSRCNYVKAVAVVKDLDMYQSDELLNKEFVKRKYERCDDSNRGPYDYLLSMQMRSMTVAKVEELEKECGKIKAKIKTLESSTPQSLWKADLEKFKVAYQVFLKTRTEEIDPKRKRKSKKSVLE